MKPARWEIRKRKSVESWAAKTSEAVESVKASETVKSIEGREPIGSSKASETSEATGAKPSAAERQRIESGPTKIVKAAEAKRIEPADTTKTTSSETASSETAPSKALPAKAASKTLFSKATSKPAFESEMASIDG